MRDDHYRAAFEAGYFYGRIDAINALPYDDRTPLARREDTEVSADVEPAGRTFPAAE
ncbi:hypothetical protein [Paenibacillus graminis]|uniref:hypothetical protein n=1 Tax=Paenibacillus graminis TaxID=189425 RepID=UPI002DBB1DC1|nr:hypothetical protein [Paenibacillus graminis]MEC0167882.1 hypothetical protein [Paenibacillus graminis]